MTSNRKLALFILAAFINAVISLWLGYVLSQVISIKFPFYILIYSILPIFITCALELAVFARHETSTTKHRLSILGGLMLTTFLMVIPLFIVLLFISFLLALPNMRFG